MTLQEMRDRLLAEPDLKVGLDMPWTFLDTTSRLKEMVRGA